MRRRRQRLQPDVWPVIADGFLAMLAVVIVMASGRQPADPPVEVFKREIQATRTGEFAGIVDDVEVQTKWARLVFSAESLSFPKCRWAVPLAQQEQIHGLFRWIGISRQLIRQIRIEGHADRKWEGPGCKDVGPFMDNLQLSQNRARAVYNVVLGFGPEQQGGLNDLLNDRASPERAVEGLGYLHDLAKRGCLEVAGYGDRHPRNRVDPDSPQNRRVEVVLEFRELPINGISSAGSAGVCETSR